MLERDIITYKWNEGVYSLQDMIILVKYNNLTPEDFFEITRLDYAAAAQKYEQSSQKKQVLQ